MQIILIFFISKPIIFAFWIIKDENKFFKKSFYFTRLTFVMLLSQSAAPRVDRRFSLNDEMNMATEPFQH